MKTKKKKIDHEVRTNFSTDSFKSIKQKLETDELEEIEKLQDEDGSEE